MKRIRLADRLLPDYTKGEEIANMVSHIVGGALGLTATALCTVFAALHHNAWGVVSGAVYGFTMILLYTMSSIYHGLHPWLTAKKVFQVIDHCTIFLLIAGTYTPFSLVSLRSVSPALGWSIFCIIWGFAVLGIVLNAIDLERYKIFSMVCYLGMGWCIIIAIRPLYSSIGVGGMVLLVAGGVAYTIGAVCYMLGHKRRYVHFLFHIFVVIGSLLHFFSILFYVM